MTKNVLVVEDNPGLLNSIKFMFKHCADEELRLLTAGNGEEAVEILEREPVDVLVTDLYMPKMDGLELLALISRRFPDIPCIVMTAFSSSGIMEILTDLRVYRFYPKPFNPDDLLDGINEAIREKSLGKGIKSLSAGGFLELLEEDQRSCTLEAISREGRKGYFYLVDGRLYDAKCEGLLGEDAAANILSWDRVSLKLTDLPPEEIRGRIQSSLKRLISKAGGAGPGEEQDKIEDKPGVFAEVDQADNLFRAIGKAESGDFRSASGQLARILKLDPDNGKAWMWYARTSDNLRTINIALKNGSIVSPDDPEIAAEIKKLKSAAVSGVDDNEPLKHCPFCWAPVAENRSLCHYCKAYLDIREDFFRMVLTGAKEETDLKTIIESFQRYTKTAIFDPDNDWARFCLAMIHINLSQWDEALEELGLAAEIAPQKGVYRKKIELLSGLMDEMQSLFQSGSHPKGQADDSRDAAREKGKSIMVVEDSATTRTVIRKMLSQKGYHVIEAGDGAEAIAKFGLETPDLVLLDIVMPGMDGYQTLSTLRKKYDLKDIPVIMLTAKDSLIDKLRGKMSGTSEYLTKPFNSLELVRKIEDHLG